MSFLKYPLVAAALLPFCLSAQSAPADVSHDYPYQPVPFTQVHLNDTFWAQRIETNRAVTIPFAFKQCEESGRVYNFEAAAAALAGHPYADVKIPGFPFDDTDIYKVIEGASYSLSVKYDAALDAYVDSLIVKIAAAQEPDGYLYTARTMSPAHPHAWAGATRWTNDPSGSHELYNLGHLYEAAVAHYQATGKRNLLDIALRTADLLDNTFGPDKQSIWPGHQIVEMGLVKLYRATGEERYLKLAKFMLDQRGSNGVAGGTYNQSQLPVVQQKEAVGHAVRAVYMYAGMADVAALTGDTSYVSAIDTIWRDAAETKTYITGGIGSVPEIEGFGAAYELPNDKAYCETCAAIGYAYWNERMFLLHGESKYIDVMERSLYNGIASGVSLDGMSFFYGNPLESKGDIERKHWFGCACCPGNITRFMASLSGYQYAVRGKSVYVNLFASGTANVKLDGVGEVKLVQETRYPWDGDIAITVHVENPQSFELCLRVPGWALEKPSAGDLYRYTDAAATAPKFEVNGTAVEVAIQHDGYVHLSREWKNGDMVRMTLPMPIRRVAANNSVEADRGKVALQRGPIVYCVESTDNAGRNISELQLPSDAILSVTFNPELLGGVEVIQCGEGDKAFTAIPYCTWDNRGSAAMTVWIQTSK